MPLCAIHTFLSSVKDCELVQGHIYNVPQGGSLNKNTMDILPDWQSCKAHCEANYTAAIFFTFRDLYDIQNCYCLPSYSSSTQNHLWTSGRLHCENTGNTTKVIILTSASNSSRLSNLRRKYFLSFFCPVIKN